MIKVFLYVDLKINHFGEYMECFVKKVLAFDLFDEY